MPPREYNSWKKMKQRCYNPNQVGFKNYGGRGIAVCERWKNSFQNFFEDMGPRPTPEHTLERIDNSKDYCPENCRWATRKEQAQNRRDASDTVYLTLNGVTQSAASWARKLGIKIHIIYSRKRYGWSDFDILTRPVRSHT